MSLDVTESAKFYELLAWLELNKKRVITGAVIAAIIALVCSFFFWHKEQREIKANVALLQLGLPLGSGEGHQPPSATAYLKVAGDFANTQAGARALLLAAGALFSDNQYAEALAQFRKFHDKYPNSNLAPIAAIGIAACLESQDITQEAIKAYQDVIARFPNESVAGQAKLALGRLYEGNKQPAQALKVYEELTRQTARSVWSSEANERREQLLLQHPELAPTNVPSTTLGSLAPTNLATAAAKPELISTSIVSQTNMLMPASTAAVSHVHATTNAPSPVVTNAIPQTNTSVAPASNAPSLPETNATSPKPGAGPAK